MRSTFRLIHRCLLVDAVPDRWDAHQEAGFYSERVEIVFRAVYDTCKHLVGKAASVQNRGVMDHIAELVSPISSHNFSSSAGRRCPGDR